MATVSNTKSYSLGPQDGWTLIVDGSVTNIAFVRISAYPHTLPFYVYSGTSAPAATVKGVRVCHDPFEAFTGGANTSKFYVKVADPSPNSPSNDGRLTIDVYSDGGVLS